MLRKVYFSATLVNIFSLKLFQNSLTCVVSEGYSVTLTCVKSYKTALKGLRKKTTASKQNEMKKKETIYRREKLHHKYRSGNKLKQFIKPLQMYDIIFFLVS